jgi:hypothetical protein
MIHKEVELLRDKIYAAFPELKACAYYKGEFEDGSEWNPVFPSVFVNCSQVLPARESSAKWLTANLILNIYVGVKLEVEDQQNFFNELIKFINNFNEDTSLNKIYTFKLNSITLKGYFYNIEAYQLELSVEKMIDNV